ncbi:MAG: ATP phosphoribosyltransferase [Pseudomonadota bacterium]
MNDEAQKAEPLVLGVPSKGRLEEATTKFFARAGLKLEKRGGAREYRGNIAGVDGVDVAYLSASEIAGELAAGSIHLGVTGMDLIHEKLPDPEAQVVTVTELGFGFANVVVAVPDSWIDVQTMDDLEDVAAGFRARHGRRMQLATKYIRLTRSFFRKHGVVDYRIVESLGATEGAPASGAADLIVDITTSGATLAANHLRVLSDGEILKSQASLVASKNAAWTTSAQQSLKELLSRIAAEERARTVFEVRLVVPEQARLARELGDKFGCTVPFGAVAGQGQLVIHVPKTQIWPATEWLRSRGASAITIGELAYVVEPNEERFADVIRALS